MVGSLLALALLSALPSTSEASFARRLGSRYGGTLSSNTSTSTQQLTADPVTVLRGSTSTEYDPSVVHLQDVNAEPGFFITQGFVGVADKETEGERLVTLGQFFDSYPGQYVETGYLQVFYSREEGPMLSALSAPVDDGYVVVDTDGETDGDNTHTMLFKYLAENPNTLAHYRLYADDGERGSSYDSLVSTEDPNFEIRDIQEANVAGALIPLPAAVGPALLGLGAVGVVKKLRRRLLA
jgi:hypothetical protein